MFSIVMPMDTNRLNQFKETKLVYDEMPQKKEFLIPTRSYKKVSHFLQLNHLGKDVRLLPYTHDLGFNPSKAFNIGVRESKYDNIIITSPEVKPSTEVLKQLTEYIGQNVICEVWDEWHNGNLTLLVNSIHRGDSPAMYFLAMFNKKDIEAINGWDEDFMKGYAYEDNDFGERWKRAGLPFIVVDEIKALHQYHPRNETIRNGMATNKQKFDDNNDSGVIQCSNGLVKL